MTHTPARIRPVPDAATEAFWSAARDGRLVVQRCSRCTRFQHPPQPLCGSCGGAQLEFADVSGDAVLWSWTTTCHTASDVLRDALPYVCIVVELTEQSGLFLLGDLIDRPCADDRLRVGAPMRVVFDRIDGDVVLPQFAFVEDGRR